MARGRAQRRRWGLGAGAAMVCIVTVTSAPPARSAPAGAGAGAGAGAVVNTVSSTASSTVFNTASSNDVNTGAAPAAQLVSLHRTTLVARPATARAGAASTPLGSVWKLFVFSYLVAQGVDAPPYRCAAIQRSADDEYCCDPGETVSRDAALARSCGPYFDPVRVGISASGWRQFWQARKAPAWLWSLPAMQPGTRVPVARLLAALQQVPAPARAAARAALLPNSTRDATLLGAIGSGPRFKTWTWHDAAGQRIGGGAGWLADGSPFWLGGRGPGRRVMAQQADTLAWQAQAAAGARADGADGADGAGSGGSGGTSGAPAHSTAAQPCVAVRMFARYPLAAVTQMTQVTQDTQMTQARPGDVRAATDGPLQGRHRLRFENGQQLTLQATPALRLVTRDGRPHIEGRFGLEDYVARVIDREGDARQPAAARALAVAARTWLVQNSPELAQNSTRPSPAADGCLTAPDDSRAQRVSPQPASVGARAAALFTQGLVLTGMPVRYHRDQAAPGVMAWTGAVQAAQQGQGFVAILRAAYPQAAWGSVDSGAAADCTLLPDAAAWLRVREQRWRGVLQAQAGFEPTAAQLQVCHLPLGVPHADARHLQIRLREWASREGRVTLVHEYLHLAFRHHPRGTDEAFVERLAQQLVDT